MAERIRFFLDQHVPAAAAQGLRRRGADVLTAQEADRCGWTDSAQLRLAGEERRVIITFDDDFLTLATAVPHAGLAFCSASKYSVGELIRALLIVYEVLDAPEMTNHIEFL